MNWNKMELESIISGKSVDGTSLLIYFLNDYREKFNVKNVNPGCMKCLRDYLNRFKNDYKMKNSDCKYVLQEKYNGIPLKFGSNILVSNSNITDEYAELLISRYTALKAEKGLKFDVSSMFSKFPKPKKVTEKPKEESKKVVSKLAKVKKKRNNKK